MEKMMSDTETEVKFLLANPPQLISRLQNLGATLIQPRVLEINLRFDDNLMSLSHAAKVLRLRKDSTSHLTFKGAGIIDGEVLSRQEIEFEVSDLEAARHLLESLGYHVFTSYEKYRQTYKLDQLNITVDEMPFGNFSEIEGPDASSIKEGAKKLHLEWGKRINVSYLNFFLQLKQKFLLPFNELTFANFQNSSLSVLSLDLEYADEAGI